MLKTDAKQLLGDLKFNSTAALSAITMAVAENVDLAAESTSARERQHFTLHGVLISGMPL